MKLLNQKQLLERLIKLAGSQKKLADLIDVDESRLSEWKNEKHAITLNTILKMCEKLNINLEIKL